MASHNAGCLRYEVNAEAKAEAEAEEEEEATRQQTRKPAHPGCPPRSAREIYGNAADTAAGLRPNPRGDFHGSYHASNAGSRCPLRSPNALLEPEDGPLHFRSSQQDSHHQPRKDAADVQRRAEVRASTGSQSRHDPVRRHEA